MYIEFVLIYVGLGIIVALLIAILVMQIVLLKSRNRSKIIMDSTVRSNNMNSSQSNSASDGVVFCMHCANQFSATQQVCPHCGTRR